MKRQFSGAAAYLKTATSNRGKRMAETFAAAANLARLLRTIGCCLLSATPSTA